MSSLKAGYGLSQVTSYGSLVSVYSQLHTLLEYGSCSNNIMPDIIAHGMQSLRMYGMQSHMYKTEP